MDELDDGSDDISNSLAAACTGTLGVSDDAAVDQPLPDRLADDVEDYDRHAVEKDLEPEELVEEDERRTTGTKVPLGALQEERAKRQQLQFQLEAQQQELAQYQQQLAQYKQFQQQVAQAQQLQQQQEAVPDFNEDPEGHVKAIEAKFTQQLQNMQQAREYEQAAAQVQHRAQELGQFVTQAQNEFAEQNPEYYEAYDLVHARATEEIRQMYPGATDQQIQATQAAAVFGFLNDCQRTGQNPCELVFQRAQALGFAPGQHVPNSSARLPKNTPTSLSTLSADGRAPDQRGAVKAKDVANLSNAEFDQLFNSMKDGSVTRMAF